MRLLGRLILPVLLAMQSTLLVFAASDDAQAERWFRLAAEQGLADAQYDLGLMYVDGKGVVEDDMQGAHWLHKAADQGHANAQYRLGRMYEEGEGVTKDRDEAVRWYRLAGEQGIALAQHRLGKLYASPGGISARQKNRSSQLSSQGQATLVAKPPTQPSQRIDVPESEVEPVLEMLAACAFIKPPQILPGTTLSTNKMRDLSKSVREYAAAMQESLDCMDSVESKLGATISDQQRATIDTIYNNGVDQLNFITSEFNKQVSAYKMRQRIPDLRNQELGIQ